MVVIFVTLDTAIAQNPLVITPALTGTNFNLTVQSGTKTFYGSTPTPTYGINGAFLSPTIIVNKGDSITLNVINNLPVKTTMHWHGLHVAPSNDGGPHQSIAAGTTWSPSFEILNNAGTFWYHPHGEGQTEQQVSKGLAGMFIIHDAVEQSLGLPQTYGVDDIPLITQSKAFDLLQQIAIADHMDT
jgi:bilirubin oxidase